MRRFFGYECDHMRPVVCLNGVWHHVGLRGDVEAPCGASSVYRVTATYEGGHYMSNYVLPAGATDA